MKKSETKEQKVVTMNKVEVSGLVTYCSPLKKKDGSVFGYSLGVKAEYEGNNGKTFTAYPSFNLYTTEYGEPEKGDNVTISAHFETHKYTKEGKDIFTTSCIVDTIE